jgi:hypothetical protein
MTIPYLPIRREIYLQQQNTRVSGTVEVQGRLYGVDRQRPLRKTMRAQVCWPYGITCSS